MDAGKSLIASKTFWFNVLSAVVIVAGVFGFGEHQAAPWVGEAATVAVAVINIVIRLMTREPITSIV